MYSIFCKCTYTVFGYQPYSWFMTRHFSLNSVSVNHRTYFTFYLSRKTVTPHLSTINAISAVITQTNHTSCVVSLIRFMSKKQVINMSKKKHGRNWRIGSCRGYFDY